MNADYPIDAPTVVRNLALGGLAALLLALFRVDIRLGTVVLLHFGWYFPAASMLGGSLWMLYEAKAGKYGVDEWSFRTSCALAGTPSCFGNLV